jgi:multidrug efflux pump subunit AcrB
MRAGRSMKIKEKRSFITELAVNNRVTVFVLLFLLIIAGLWSYYAIPREASPDVKIPYVFISTQYRGVSPGDIETSITVPIEKKLKGLKNVKEIKSNSSEGSSSISVEFVTGTDIDLALQWVKDKVDAAKRELPSDLENDPSVFEVNLSEQPILVLALSGSSGMRNLKDIAENIKEDIEAVQGVLELEIVGGREREIHIEVDPDKLTAYGVPFSLLYSAVSGENQNVSGGNIAMGDGRYQLRVPGEFKNIEEFRNLIVTVIKGSPVYLSNIAVINDSYRDITSESRFNSRQSINLYIKKRVGENIISITDKVKEYLEKNRKNFPSDMTISILTDQSNEVRMMVDDLENNIFTGLILVVAVLMVSMGFINALLAGVAIPLSMLLSFIFLKILGITLNMVTLFSLMLALGMLVDNAIVIVENIYRFRQQGVSRLAAAKLATGEVAIPIIASALTTIFAFFPMLWWPGIMGEFMKYLPITLITTLVASVLVALIFNPVFCSVFLKGNSKTLPQKTNPEQTHSDKVHPDKTHSDKTHSDKTHSDKAQSDKAQSKNISDCNLTEEPVEHSGLILKIYEKILITAVNHRIKTVILGVLILVLSFCYWLYNVGLEKSVEFFPSTQPASCYINLDVPEGTDMDTLRSLADTVEKRLKSFDAVPDQFKCEQARPLTLSEGQKEKIKIFKKEQKIENEELISDINNIRFVYTRLSSMSGGQSSFDSERLANHIGVIFHKFKGRVESTTRTVEKIRARLKGIAGARITIAEAQGGPPTGKAINIEVSGNNFNVLEMISSKIADIIKSIPHVRDVENDMSKQVPTLEILVDRKKAGLLGLTTSMIGSAVKTAFTGWNVSTYRENNEDFDIFLMAGKSLRNDLEIFKKMYLPTQNGSMIPLGDIVSINYTNGYGSIRRVNHRRVVTVSADVDTEKMPGAVARSIAEKLLKNADMPSGYNFKFTGENQFQEESQDFLSKAFIVAVFLIFIVLVTQFNSILHPAIILFSVILSMGGAFLGMAITKIPFGVIMSGVGIISLAGVVVNNAIVLLDYTNQLLERGYSLTNAVINAGKTRFRPVILTAVTTVLGLIPMITGISYDFKKFELLTSSETSQFWYSMAVAIAYGLGVATILTLVMIPAMFHLGESIHARAMELIKELKSKLKRTFRLK